MNPAPILDASTPSSLHPDTDGKVHLSLFQLATGVKIEGRREELACAQAREGTADDIEACATKLRSTRPGGITAMSYHPGLAGCEDVLRQLSADRTIVGLAGVDGANRNTLKIATNGEVISQYKHSLSSEDQKLHVQKGTKIHLFRPPPGDATAVSWAALNCHDYTDVDLLVRLQEAQVELLVVLTYNTATRLYWEYAVSDVHRLCCFVVIVNVAELGGSAVHAPFRRIGYEKNAQFGAGGKVFAAKGPAALEIELPLEIGELRRIRADFIKHGFSVLEKKGDSNEYFTPIVPSEHFMDTFDRSAGEPKVDSIEEIEIDWNFETPVIGIAQLRPLDIDVYKRTRYRIRNDAGAFGLTEQLRLRLHELVKRRRLEAGIEGPVLDLLVLPEVYVPRTFLPELRAFCERHRTIVVAGVDYAGDSEDENANECVVMIPGRDDIVYRKNTRSQYDALGAVGHSRMLMKRGNRLVRFSGTKGGSFGILICYDFSHLNLMSAINLQNRFEPLDFVVVVAHNPFGELYRSACIADSHRFYQYIVMCNVSDYGGSGIFGPVRTAGARQVVMEVGKGVDTIAVGRLELDKLREARRKSDHELHKDGFMRKPGIFQ